MGHVVHVVFFFCSLYRQIFLSQSSNIKRGLSREELRSPKLKYLQRPGGNLNLVNMTGCKTIGDGEDYSDLDITILFQLKL
jgi:hypothetical protein